MATLLLRLAGPMQSWGITSRFNERDTGREPSKSGVVGVLAAAMGIDRSNWTDLKPLTLLTMGVRHDRPGVLKRDYQTAGAARSDTIIKADGTQAKDGVISDRFYLADAVFLVGLEGADRTLLDQLHAALLNPFRPLGLGRKSYVPSEPIWLKAGLRDGSLHDAMTSWPWLTSRRRDEEFPERLMISLESGDGTGAQRMDQLLSSFADRRFGTRFVRTEWVQFPREVTRVPD